MKRILIAALIMFPILGMGQLQSLIIRGDTLFSLNPSTGVEVQLTKTVPTQIAPGSNTRFTSCTSYYSCFAYSLYNGSLFDKCTFKAYFKADNGYGRNCFLLNFTTFKTPVFGQQGAYPDWYLVLTDPNRKNVLINPKFTILP